jgi:hypothetical protein
MSSSSESAKLTIEFLVILLNNHNCIEKRASGLVAEFKFPRREARVRFPASANFWMVKHITSNAKLTWYFFILLNNHNIKNALVDSSSPDMRPVFDSRLVQFLVW